MLAVTLVLMSLRGASLDPTALDAQAGPAVVKLVVLDRGGEERGSGSGFLVSADGRVMTNHHVIAHAERMTALIRDGREVAVTGVLADDATADIAVVQVEGSGYPSLAFAPAHPVKVGDPVAVIGSPVGLEETLSVGIVTAFRKDGVHERADPEGGFKSWQLQIDAAISPGSSGSPVLRADGRVVGVAVGERLDGNGLYFAVPAELARPVLEGIPPGARPRPLGRSQLLRNLAVSAAVATVIGLVLFLVSRPARARRAPARQWLI